MRKEEKRGEREEERERERERRRTLKKNLSITSKLDTFRFGTRTGKEEIKFKKYGILGPPAPWGLCIPHFKEVCSLKVYHTLYIR